MGQAAELDIFVHVVLVFQVWQMQYFSVSWNFTPYFQRDVNARQSEAGWKLPQGGAVMARQKAEKVNEA